MRRIPLGTAAATAITLTLAANFGGATGLRPPGGPYQPPLGEVQVLAAFDPPAQPWQAGHRGVDLSAATADPVFAPADGVVVFAGRVVDRGVVSIDHGGIRTTYEPVDPAVDQGSAVTRGSVIGQLGTGAHCSARCLHWGAMLADEYIDPLTLLRNYSPVLKAPFV
jgi:murein DD-endopeptidase MepM/ murein hydrolase activator NlpD